ncbi:MAG: hypothetical protein PCFJNLEI_01298 [Verrucomicrobiae bacterium]|nr:hypothetical protein [Verrucomicrobiae bacterium]
MIKQSRIYILNPVHGRGFTLIELMAVVLVILVLAAIAFGVGRYVKQRVAISAARAQLAALEAALESYKSDWGFYPRTGPERISFNQVSEGSNNLVLYRAVSGDRGPTLPAGKRYMAFPSGTIRTNMHLPLTMAGTSGYQQLGIFDPWGKLYNYYNSPNTPYENIKTNAYAGYTRGGQVNVITYDLFSYGPDGGTFVPGNPPYAYDHPWYGWYETSALWGRTNSANDDITNWK